MQLTKDEQARLTKLKAIAVDELTAEQKTELKTLQEKEAKKEQDPPTQADLDRIYAELQKQKTKTQKEKDRADALELTRATEAEEFKPLYETELEKNKTMTGELDSYRKTAAARLTTIKKDIPENLLKALEDGDDPEIIARNLAKYDEWVALGFLKKQGGNNGGGGNNPGGNITYKWQDLVDDTALMIKVKNEQPELYEKLKKAGIKAAHRR